MRPRFWRASAGEDSWEHFCQDHFSTSLPQICLFYFLNLGQKGDSFLRKPDSPYQGSESPGNRSGAVFAPTRFSLVRISIRDLKEILSKEFRGWGWGSKSDPHLGPFPPATKFRILRSERAAGAEIKQEKAHKHKLFGPVALGTTLGMSWGQTGFVPETSPLCPRDKPRLSPYFTQWKPSLSGWQTQFVPGTTRGQRGAEKVCVLKVYVPFLLAKRRGHSEKFPPKRACGKLRWVKARDLKSDTRVRRNTRLENFRESPPVL